MKWQGILFACLCLLTYAECRWKHEKHGYKDNANEMTTKPNHRADPPDHTKLIPMARYVLHNAGKFFRFFKQNEVLLI